MKLYDFPLSGHAHKARLMLSLLELDYERVEVALAEGAQNSAEFLALNPFHHVPVLEDEGLVIRDSNAILVYLAQKYDSSWYPNDPESVARIQEWLAVATKELADGPAAARLVNVFGAKLNHEQTIAQAHALLEIIEARLEGRQWIAIERATIADIALYSYIAHAPEGDVSLEPYINIRQWLKRIESLPGFVAMPSTPVGLVA
jgi:glutathione S-transferase